MTRAIGKMLFKTSARGLFGALLVSLALGPVPPQALASEAPPQTNPQAPPPITGPLDNPAGDRRPEQPRNQCEQQGQEQGQRQSGSPVARTCSDARRAIRNQCQSSSGEDMANRAGYGMALQQAAQGANQTGQQGQAQQAQCANMAPVLGALAGANGMKAAQCATAIDRCKRACEAEVQCWQQRAQQGGGQQQQGGDNPQERLRAAQEELAQCDQGSEDAGKALAQMAALGAAMAMALMCAKQTGMEQPSPSPSPSPSPTPGDCSDPRFAATSIQCICEKNPRDPVCSRLPLQGGGGFGDNQSARTGTPFSPDDDPGLGGELAQSAGPGNFAKGNNDGLQGGGGGGGLGAGGGLNALGQDQMAAGADKAVDKNVIQGQSGGNNGLMSPGGGGGGGGPGPGRGSAFDRFNLSKFLPQGKDFKNRGLSGMSIPAVDGVTGPGGLSIWEKATRQYQEQDRRGEFLRVPANQPRGP